MKKIVYVFDDINYQSGAQKAAFYQMQCLSDKYDVYAMSLSKPDEELEITATIIRQETLWEKADAYTKSFKEMLISNKGFSEKAGRIFYAISMRLGIGELFLTFFLYKKLIEELEKFDVVVVVSEASKLRNVVGGLAKPRKVQWIHTDYERWCQYSEWTRAVTKNDSCLYKKYDCIVVLSESCRQGMIRRIPQLSEKIVVIPNMVNITDIQRKSLEEAEVFITDKAYNFVTVGRLDKEKNFGRILDICKCLSADKIDYTWYVIGDGPLRESIQKQIKRLDLQENVILLGRLENPYPVMKQCDIFVLLSDYEGTPVTIDEAVVLDLPVISTPVGGIPEQLRRYGCGKLLEGTRNLYKEFTLAIDGIDEKKVVSIDIINRTIFEKMIKIVEG
ncbi:glycosyltransferase [Lacrimispora saccharolytica]|uniref:Glycosyl transferase group 1 n=1 Tax=Lacrimispora saccharolytica (strain ATCC 35040 / DSM 2544 / NRCC 2533 / WM1) TaxID=610130 RepID=D9R4J3_LACSW|nr:glycosyltransferase [Lacrimispora saccharolytica]ADL03177.1 glycosyl transferase group 1 [[Clostridium] saccharolyticum WM1]QRV18648.1 glycosyltransferase [Lacrimispora saccharolytica]